MGEMGEVGKAEMRERAEKQCAVSLTAREWSAVTMAVSHGVTAVKNNERMPVAVVNAFLRDLAVATDRMATALETHGGPS